MPEETVVAPPPVAGRPENSGSQVQSIEGQPSETGQNAGQTQVEGSESQAPSQEAGGGQRPSQFYQKRNRDRQSVQDLQREMAEIKSILQQQRPSAPQSQSGPAPADKNKQFFDAFLLDPRGSLENLFKEVAQQEVPTIAQRVYQEGSLERQWQDAEKLITSNEAFRRDEDNFINAIKDINGRYGITRWSNQEPLEATRLAIEIYEREQKGQQPQPQIRPPNPLAPKKGQMVGTATGSPAMTGAPDRNALLAELKKMQLQLVDNIELRNDPKFRERLDAIKVGLAPPKK